MIKFSLAIFKRSAIAGRLISKTKMCGVPESLLGRDPRLRISVNRFAGEKEGNEIPIHKL